MSAAEAGAGSGPKYCAECLAPSSTDRCHRPACAVSASDQRSTQSHLRPHTLLAGRYYLGRALGQGGFGVTYKALDQHPSPPRIVAVKEYLPLGMCDRAGEGHTLHPFRGELEDAYRKGLERFLEEGNNLRKFSLPPYKSGSDGAEAGGHANIVGCTEVFQANGTAYLVMDFIAGPTLSEYLRDKGGTIACSAATRILVRLMDGVRAMHREELLHRDISPSNIMLSPLPGGSGDAFQAKLVDFGAARYAIKERSRTLSVIFKDGYAPAEQYYSSGKQGPWTDVYAVAATYYRCITAVAPPPALNRAVKDECVAPSILYRQARAQAATERELSPALERVLMKGLAVATDQRYQTIAEFQQALLELPESWVEQQKKKSTAPAVAPVATTPPRRFGWAIAGGVLAISLVALGAAGLTWRHQQSDENKRRAIDLYNAKQFAVAAPLLERACTDQSWEACKDLGNLLRDGRGIAPDPTRAYTLFKTACSAGYTPACNNLAGMYADSKVPQDILTAVDLYKDACNHGLAISCSNAASLYQTSDTVRNDSLAAAFYGKACAANLADSCHALGSMYEKGWRGQGPDLAQATANFKKACDAGSSEGCNSEGAMYFEGGAGLKRNPERAVALFRTACGHGLAIACANLGLSYEQGVGVARDDDQAATLYTQACAATYAAGCTHLGNVYARMGKGAEAALIPLKKGCTLGDRPGCDEVTKLEGAASVNAFVDQLLKPAPAASKP